MSLNFEGRVAIVTGAGNGLGFEYAQYLAKHGAKVLINDLGGDPVGLSNDYDTSVAAQAAAKVNAAGGEAIYNSGSVADKANVDAMFKQVIDTWGRIDIIVNNAGIASTEVFPAISGEEMHKHLDVHLLGNLYTIQAAWPHMAEQGYGRIINTASNSVFGFTPTLSYPAMKSAIFGMTNGIALQGYGKNINVNTICPAAFTRMSAQLDESPLRTRLEQDFKPEKLAPVIAYLCHESSEITGQAFSVGGGKITRIVFAETDAASVNMSMESVVKAMSSVMTAPTPHIMNTTLDDLANIGFAPEELAILTGG